MQPRKAKATSVKGGFAAVQSLSKSRLGTNGDTVRFPLRCQAGHSGSCEFGDEGEAEWQGQAGKRAGFFSELVDREHLATLVVAAARTGNVRRRSAAAFGAHVQLAGAPPLTGATEALFHLRRFSFRDCHDRAGFGEEAHITVNSNDVNEGIGRSREVQSTASFRCRLGGGRVG